jgi:DNA-binding transcriptional LysR family regulator
MTRDAVIVGGGIAGLAAAWRLRHRDVLLLEAGDRLGGRMRSDPCGEYWLNYGAHLFPAPGSLVDTMARECDLATVPVTGGMMGLAVGATVLERGPVETYPLRLPLALRDRVAFARAGLRVKRALRAYHRLERRYDFEDDRTFGELLGPLPQIRCFCAAHELGSFTAAAAALRVSQPAVAEQVRKLEQALGADLFVRAGRGVVPTEAGRAFAEHAARSLRAVEDAADSVGELAAVRGGTVAVGTFGEPSGWRLDEVATAFLQRHPGVSVRLVGRNSSAIADRVRRGELEAGVVLLPLDDDLLDVRPVVRDEVLYVSAVPARVRRPATIERLAATPLVFYDAESADGDPIRRQLAERAQALGVRLQPKVEVELKDIALRLVAAGVGDTYLPSAYTRAAYYPAGLGTAPFSPPLYDTFAIVTRTGARLSAGVRELLADIEAHMRAVAGELDRSR